MHRNDTVSFAHCSRIFNDRDIIIYPTTDNYCSFLFSLCTLFFPIRCRMYMFSNKYIYVVYGSAGLSRIVSRTLKVLLQCYRNLDADKDQHKFVIMVHMKRIIFHHSITVVVVYTFWITYNNNNV